MAVAAGTHRAGRPTAPAGVPGAGRGEVAELVRMLVRTVLPTGVLLSVILAVYAGTGHPVDRILQDRFPDDSEWSGFLTIVFGSALLVCAGIALGALVVARAWYGSPAADGSPRPPAVVAGLALSLLVVMIAFDDLMMVHDSLLPGSGLPESVGLAFYGAIGLVLAAWAVGPMRTEGLALTFLGALTLLAGSLGGDVLEELAKGRDPALAVVLGHLEDVVKLLAYSALCHLCVLLALRVFSRVLQANTERAAREAAERAPRGPDRIPLRVARRPVAAVLRTAEEGVESDALVTAPLAL